MSTVAQKKYRTGLRWIIGSGAIAIASLGGYFAYIAWAGATNQTVEVQVLEIERGDVIKTVSAGGVVTVGNQQTLKAPTSSSSTAIVETIEVLVNSRIQEGDVLIRLRNPEGRNQIEQKQATVAKQRLEVQRQERAVQKAEVELTQARRSLQTQQQNQTDIQTAAITLQQAQNNLAKRQADIPALQEELATTTELVAQGYIAETERRTAQDALRNAQADIRNFEQGVRQAQVALDQAQLTHRQQLQDAQALLQTHELQVQDVREQVIAAQQELNNTIGQLTNAQEQFAKESLIRATTDGRVLAVHTKPGAVLAQGDQLLTIGNPRREEVELQLSTLDVPLVKTSQSAEVTAIGVVSGTFPARVSRLDQVAISDQGNSNRFGGGGDTGTVAAVVVLNQPSGTLIPGGQVSIEIEVDAAEDVLKLPPQFIQGEGDDAFVWVVDESGRVDQRPVEVGLVGDTATEIQSGLKVGETVASPPPDAALEPGMTVTPQDAESPPEELAP